MKAEIYFAFLISLPVVGQQNVMFGKTMLLSKSKEFIICIMCILDSVCRAQLYIHTWLNFFQPTFISYYADMPMWAC